MGIIILTVVTVIFKVVMIVMVVVPIVIVTVVVIVFIIVILIVGINRDTMNNTSNSIIMPGGSRARRGTATGSPSGGSGGSR